MDEKDRIIADLQALIAEALAVADRIRAEAWDEGGLHELNQWAPPHATVPTRISEANPYRRGDPRGE